MRESLSKKMKNNLDEETVKSLGEEWSRFDQYWCAVGYKVKV
jgi:hypothetical protein